MRNKIAQKNATKTPQSSPKAGPGLPKPSLKKVPYRLFWPKIGSKAVLDALGHLFPSRCHFWSLLATSGTLPEPSKSDFRTPRDLPKTRQRLIFNSSSQH